MSKLTVAVTGTGSLIGQAIIKALKSSSWKDRLEIIGFDYFPYTIGSLWVKETILLPDILKPNVCEEEWLLKIIETISQRKVSFLFIGVDFELPLFAKYKKQIEKESGCTILVSDEQVISVAADKYLTYMFLKDHGFAYPKTYTVAELKECTLSFPCIVKPRKGSRSRDMNIVHNQDELAQACARTKNAIAQELVGDVNTEYTCGVICFEGAVKEMIVLRRLLRDGNTELAFHDHATPKSIYDYVRSIASTLKPYGACNFQLRFDKDNQPKLFEINARHSGTTYMRSLFGFNEVEYILNYLNGVNNKPFVLRNGMVRRFYEETFIQQ